MSESPSYQLSALTALQNDEVIVYISNLLNNIKVYQKFDKSNEQLYLKNLLYSPKMSKLIQQESDDSTLRLNYVLAVIVLARDYIAANLCQHAAVPGGVPLCGWAIVLAGR